MSLACTYLHQARFDSAATSYTFYSSSFGAAQDDRYIAVAVSSRGTIGVSSVTVTVHGVAARVDYLSGYSGTGNAVAVAVAHVPYDTVGNVDVQFNSSQSRCDIALYRVVGGMPVLLDTAGATDFSTTPTGLTVDIQAGGAVIGKTYSRSDASTWTWVNLTEDNDYSYSAFASVSSAHADISSGTSRTVTVTSTSTEANKAAVVSWAAGTAPAVPPQWTTYEWRRMIETDGWQEAVTAPERTIDARIEMIDASGTAVADLTGVASAGVTYHGDQDERFSGEVQITDPALVPRAVGDLLDNRSNLRARIWWRLLVDGLWWVEVPLCTLALESPTIRDDNDGLTISIRGRDSISIAKQGGYRGVTVDVGGTTVSVALTRLFDAVSPGLPLRITDSTQTLPDVYELGSRKPQEDWVEIAAMAGMVVRSDRDGAIVAAPDPHPTYFRADLQEGPHCPVTVLEREIRQDVINSVTVVSTSPEVTPPVVATVEDTNEDSPTWVGGAFGVRTPDNSPVRSDAVTDESSAANLARSIYERHRRPSDVITVQIPQRPDLSYRDLCRIARQRSGVVGPVRVRAWQMHLTPPGEDPPLMSVTMMERTQE